MLFDGALKFTRSGRAELVKEKPDFESLFEGFSRAKNIVMELANGLNRTQDPELCDRMSAVFHYVYTLLVEANLERDAAKADEAIELLAYERETWALAVEQAQTQNVQAVAASVTPVNPYVAKANPVSHSPLSRSA